ncbi:MAG: DUF971 domain-containing protein [candidate division KSB1 bacterium]|nr:DUF971 domain-containing protein [candidate division KSB1 bacterium]
MLTSFEDMLPVDLKKPDPHTLQIEWDDGHISRYPLEFLRRQCPCASCSEARRAPAPAQLGSPFRVLQPHEMIPADLNLRQAEVVGRYALNFHWSDGHHEGIYTFDFLRAICQCEACVKRRDK